MRLALVVALAIVLGSSTARAEEAGEIAVVVGPKSPFKSLDRSDLEAIFALTRQRGPEGLAIVPINAVAEHPTRVAFDWVVFGMHPEQMARFWLDQRIRFGQRPPREISDPKLAIRLAARLEGVVAYVPAADVDSTVRVVSWIRKGKVMPP